MSAENRIEAYRRELRNRPESEWEAYLRSESRLPGPRANLELLHAVADEARAECLLGLAAHPPEEGAEPAVEFLVACGAAGLGAAIARGDPSLWPRLRALAVDPRWRVREGVAMGLQRIGAVDMAGLLERLDPWVAGAPLERRAVVAGLCEPSLLEDREDARCVLDVLDRVTRSLEAEPADRRRAADVRALRKGLGYGWSVAIVASPEDGKRRLEQWSESRDADTRWVIRENLKKKRLHRLDADWAAELAQRTATAP